jgi:hypothetical protein
MIERTIADSILDRRRIGDASRRSIEADSTHGSRVYYGSIYNGGSMPNAVPRMFLTRPWGVTSIGSSEGNTPTPSIDTSGSVPVLIIGPKVPAVGAIVRAHRIGETWVAGHGMSGPGGTISGCCTLDPGKSYTVTATGGMSFTSSMSFLDAKEFVGIPSNDRFRFPGWYGCTGTLERGVSWRNCFASRTVTNGVGYIYLSASENFPGSGVYICHLFYGVIHGEFKECAAGFGHLCMLVPSPSCDFESGRFFPVCADTIISTSLQVVSCDPLILTGTGFRHDGIPPTTFTVTE